MLSCLIIDDEPLARKGLQEYVQDIDFLKLEGVYDNPLKASMMLDTKKIDLIFLDIQMPKITGLDFIKNLQHPPGVIFTTAYPQFALDGFELNAIDYLVKPFSFDRFWKAVTKARNLLSHSATTEHKRVENYLFIKTDNKLVKIHYDEILYIEALQNYVTVYTKTKKFISYLTMKSVEEYLPSDQFIKIHKSYIVAFSKIDSIEGNEIKIATHSIPISRSFKDEVMEKILKNKYLKR